MLQTKVVGQRRTRSTSQPSTCPRDDHLHVALSPPPSSRSFRSNAPARRSLSRPHARADATPLAARLCGRAASPWARARPSPLTGSRTRAHRPQPPPPWQGADAPPVGDRQALSSPRTRSRAEGVPLSAGCLVRCGRPVRDLPVVIAIAFARRLSVAALGRTSSRYQLATDDYEVRHNVYQPGELIADGARPVRYVHVIVEGEVELIARHDGAERRWHDRPRPLRPEVTRAGAPRRAREYVVRTVALRASTTLRTCSSHGSDRPPQQIDVRRSGARTTPRNGDAGSGRRCRSRPPCRRSAIAHWPPRLGSR